jgi:cell division protein FtsL
VIPKIKPHIKSRKLNGHSQERNRFSTARSRLKTVVTAEQNIHNSEIGRKNRSDEFDSRNGDKCYTEESKEVPLEAILNKMGHYHNTYQSASREQSGYSASKEDQRNHKDEEFVKYIDVDLEANIDYANYNNYKEKNSILLPEEHVEAGKSITDSFNLKAIIKWTSKLKSAILMVLVLAVICLTMRTIYLEVKLHSNSDEIYSLNRSVNDLVKQNSEWKTKYDQ